MGTYVDVYVFEVEKLCARLDQHYDENLSLVEGKMRPSEFLKIVMPEYGVVIGDYFVVVSNEHAEDYNAWFGFQGVLSRYYGKDPESSYRALFDLYKFQDEELGQVRAESYGPEWKDEQEWAKLGILDMPEEWEE